ncbi:D-alanine transaminase [Evansella caseinilytica]|uniref:D-alanine transaminase n=1 Tax=Evansella caseinilytica TaxID=1503961 RepID=A0A1H3PW81_9BACI|nr:aminotransferase class IV [Evansella caseinilytica]SDZ04669.1 D-alanine transaminase [Evansella caseinilytica]
MKEIAFYQNRFVDVDEKVIPIQERGHQFGDGIYEVIRVYGGTPFMLKEHLARLEKSAAAIELEMPYTLHELEAIIMEGLKRSGIPEAEVYLQITRGISSRQHHYPDASAVYSMTVREVRAIDEKIRTDGISVILLEDERWLNCYIKSLNLLPNVIAKQKAASGGHGEAIFVRDGIVTEGASSNIFAVKDNVVYTHPATKRILHGITRAKVMELARLQSVAVKEQAFDEVFLKQCDEAFITSTISEVLPIAVVDDVTLPNERPITDGLAAAYRHLFS